MWGPSWIQYCGLIYHCWLYVSYFGLTGLVHWPHTLIHSTSELHKRACIRAKVKKNFLFIEYRHSAESRHVSAWFLSCVGVHFVLFDCNRLLLHLHSHHNKSADWLLKSLIRFVVFEFKRTRNNMAWEPHLPQNYRFCMYVFILPKGILSVNLNFEWFGNKSLPIGIWSKGVLVVVMD